MEGPEGEGLGQTNGVFLPERPTTCLLTPAHSTVIPPGPGPASFSWEPAQALVFSGVGPGGAPDPLLILLQFNISLQFARSAAIRPSSLQPLPEGGRTQYSPWRFEGPWEPLGQVDFTPGLGVEGLLCPPREQGLYVQRVGQTLMPPLRLPGCGIQSHSGPPSFRVNKCKRICPW